MKVLVIEDEEKIAAFIKRILEAEGNEVTMCDNIEDVMDHRYELEHDIIILDIMLPGRNGDYLVSDLRKKKSNIPILVLSALNQISKKIDLLNLGADDYLTKPFDAQELIARIKSLYRRYLDTKSEDTQQLSETVVFYPKQFKVHREGKEIFLTKKEGELILFLFQNKGKVVRSEDILRKVWQANMGFQSNVVQSTMRRLRRKLDSGFPKKMIKTVHGIGYKVVIE